ncbi:MAG: NAD(P)/FAD-dependent oxidoreductase [Pseudomonadales bacterium]|nr:NAD(P)/FAD-dependent oxidoreductase [Pseudomonadales bacterium]
MSNPQKFDAIVVGAGVAGMYMLHKLREQGLTVKVIEAGTDVGGTWYWNRYPGCRCDVPSVEYSFSFSKEVEQKWNWTELMAGQPEILEYMNFVADHYDFRRDIEFNSKVKSAIFNEQDKNWTVKTDSTLESAEESKTYVARFCVMATGCLSVTNTPNFKGADNFEGEVYHTGTWPKEEVKFAGKRVGIIGSGSSGVQSIPVIAAKAAHLTAFQRNPVYTFPAKNRPLNEGYMEQAKKDYAEIRAGQRHSQSGIVYYAPFRKKRSETSSTAAAKPARRKPSKTLLELTPDQRQEEIKEFGYGTIAAYTDVLTNPEANKIACDLYSEALGELVHDPEVAAKLIPKNYPLGCKRPVIDTDYYATFNRENVSLVDLRESGIKEITAKGLRTENGEYEFDILVYATGYDAMTGALNNIDIQGNEGRKLVEKWEHGPRTYLGLQTEGFPNLFTVTGPQSPSVLSNVIVAIEQHVEWISDCIKHMNENDHQSIEAVKSAEDNWVEHVNEVAKGTMYTAPSCNSWYLGSNIPGKERIFLPYVAGARTYREKCEEIVANGYEGFAFG